MTALRDRKRRLSFETDATIGSYGSRKPEGATRSRRVRMERSIVVHPNPFYCTVRLKGTKQAYDVAWTTIFETGARIMADKARAERKAARKRGRNG